MGSISLFCARKENTFDSLAKCKVQTQSILDGTNFPGKMGKETLSTLLLSKESKNLFQLIDNAQCTIFYGIWPARNMYIWSTFIVEFGQESIFFLFAFRKFENCRLSESFSVCSKLKEHFQTPWNWKCKMPNQIPSLTYFSFL